MTESRRLRNAKGRYVALRTPAREPHGSADAGGTKGAKEPGSAAGEPLRPSRCAGYLRRELAHSFPAIVEGFVKQAQSGSVPHFKLTHELLQEAPEPKKRKGSGPRLLEELERMERKSTGTAEAPEPPLDDVWRD